KSKNIFFQTSYAVTDAAGTAWVLTSTGSIIKVVNTNPGKYTIAPTLLLTGILINNAPFDYFSQPAVFPYNNNNLDFSVAAPSFIDEKQVLYSYMLEGGSNAGWSTALPVNNFNLLNLSPGKYRLHVRADFPAAVYAPQFLIYSFAIQPPWWQTWWFRLLVMVAIIAIALLLTRYYVRARLERQRVAMEKKQIIEKERTRIASDLHDDLGAGLSSIRFISEKVKGGIANETTQDNIDRIVTASTELIDKMNEIIWAMNEKNDSLEDLLYYTRSYAMEYCGEHNLECTIHLPDHIPAVAVSGEMRRNIFLTIKESMHNIVKHAEANKVVIHIELTDRLSILVQDNGKGMDAFAGDKNEGNGLKNMQKRMQSIGGSMIILNDRGLRVEIRAPLPL
ncbi:MAG TPA: histidine kinase, partial [Chitinophagaceae bacterium]